MSAILNEADLQSPAWLKLKKHFDERLQDHRAKNDGRLTEAETEHLRGRIAEAKYLLEMASPPPVIKAE